MEISSQTQLRRHGQPSFCYLCGEDLTSPEQIDRDHCPPKGLFAATDRTNFPIILPTHKKCNNSWNGIDDLAGILSDALHTLGKSQDQNVTRRLDAYLLSFNGKNVTGVTNVPLDKLAARIVCGMHSLLYKLYLPPVTPMSVHVPLPEGDLETGNPIQPLDQSFAFSAEIRRALLTRTADQVNAYNGNFRYACIWKRLDSGAPCCIYAFDIYGFHNLAPKTENFPKCFVGFYSPAEVPVNASWASKIAFNIPRQEMLDPWQRT